LVAVLAQLRGHHPTKGMRHGKARQRTVVLDPCSLKYTGDHSP
jgi:hypothetical protein